jgi:hypothetical protein
MESEPPTMKMDKYFAGRNIKMENYCIKETGMKMGMKFTFLLIDNRDPS